MRDDLSRILEQLLPLLHGKTELLNQIRKNEKKISQDLGKRDHSRLEDNLIITENLISEVDLLDFQASQFKTEFSHIAGKNCTEFESLLAGSDSELAIQTLGELKVHGKIMEEIFLLRQNNNDTIQREVERMGEELADIERTGRMKNFISGCDCS